MKFNMKFNGKRLAPCVVLIGSLLCTPSCTKKDSATIEPKQVLKDYISKSFAVRDAKDRKDLLGYLTGDAKLRLQSWSDEQFLAAFVDTPRQFVRLAIKDMKPVSPIEVSITYELTYLDQTKGKDAKITNKKLCQLNLSQDHWLISDVKNIKELIEYRDELTLP